jgi:HAD superfamily hydrolase (TIGR01509 family)
MGDITPFVGMQEAGSVGLRVRGLIFDVDGVLVDSVDAHIRSWVDAFTQHGFTVQREDVHRLIGAGGGRLIQTLTGVQEGTDKSKEIADTKKALYERLYLPNVKGFSRVPELLRKLKRRGIGLAIASSATGETLARMLRIAECEDQLPVESCCPGPPKPDPRKVLDAARWLGLAPGDCAMVGDSPFDAEAAAAAGARFIGLRCGGRSDDALQPAVAIFDNPEDFERNLGLVLPEG